MQILELRQLVGSFSEKNIISYIGVLNCLTDVYNDEFELKFLVENFIEYVLSLPKNINIYIIFEGNIIIGSGTLVVESKIIRSFGRVGHIEDVVIDNENQNKGYGSELMKFLINKAKMLGCYKVLLNCDEKNLAFYEKNAPKDCTLKISKKISYYFK
tara:strand:+ start:47 stop:517 length:471 start_codon:yes stop_codon:yes gene_type:complete